MSAPPLREPDPSPPEPPRQPPASGIRVISWGKKTPSNSSGSATAAASVPAESPTSTRSLSTSPQSSNTVKFLRQPRPRLLRDTHTESTSSIPSTANSTTPTAPTNSINPTNPTNPTTPPNSTTVTHRPWSETRPRVDKPSTVGNSERSDLSDSSHELATRRSSDTVIPSGARNPMESSGRGIRRVIDSRTGALSRGGHGIGISQRGSELPVLTLPTGMTAPPTNLPNRIEGTYTDDFNILEVHDLILKRFGQLRESQIQDLTVKLAQEQHKLTVPQTVVDRKAAQAAIATLTQQLDVLTNHRDTQEYLEAVTPLIETYRSLGTTTKVVSFKTEKKSSQSQISLRSSSTNIPSLRSSSTSVPSLRSSSMNVPSPDRESKRKLRHATITQYLEIARHYIQIDVIRDTGSANICPGCQMDLTDVPKDDETGIQTCPNPRCGYEKLNLIRAMISTESSKSNTGGRNGYDDRDNFYKALMRYQGKQPNRLPDNLTTVLDNYFRSYGLPTSDDVRKMPLTERGTRGITTRELMYRALFETGNASFYEDVNLICHIVWLWTLPDVSHLEDQIMDDYDKTQKVYECIWKNRKSNLNTQYRLFKHLQLRGHKCSIEDFKMVKTREILEYHDAIWEIMCQGSRLSFIRTI